MGIKITLDAGHYGNYNRSPVNKAYYESRMNWKLHLLLKSELEKRGFTVFTTRADEEKDLALVQRGKKAAGTDLFISIHSNACGTESVDHPIAYGYVDDAEMKIDDVSRDIGSLLSEEVARVMQTKQAGRMETRKAQSDRNRDGKLNDEYYGVLHGAKSVGVAGIIMEHSFHTNLRATNWLLDDKNLAVMAAAEAEVLAKYYGQHQQGAEQKPEQKEEIYRVRKSWTDKTSQIGAFRKLENAIAICASGYSVFDSAGNAVFAPTAEHSQKVTGLPYKVRIDITNLWIRKGPGTDNAKIKFARKGEYEILAESTGKGATKWGKLGTGEGWVALDYTYRI
jgi:N-acetylmuramoyl-L-alanine amidase